MIVGLETITNYSSYSNFSLLFSHVATIPSVLCDVSRLF